MRLQFMGSGDAFGSGGRFNTCFHVTGDRSNFLIDCGASSLIALKAKEVAINSIRTIFITHFHADHFGGIPFLILDAQFFSKRRGPLTIAGPRGLAEWYQRAMETAFPGSSTTKLRFELSLVELEPMVMTTVDGVTVRPFSVNHGVPGGPFHAYRFEVEGRSIAYTGDTEWTDNLIEAGAGVDLLIAEAYFFEKKIKLHLDYQTLAERLPLIKPKRLVLTHMSEDMLSRKRLIDCEMADDGKIIDL
ncbi:MAG TPA: MBL fold metallo-hydrolase [Sedimenticola thiotaurini]|uniref:MBL fold metallo-hydrolase n=1 Tax=Sedimenticola thiotaurini TaxID=1543721 RepID=A0A831RMI1_9GAMM|nr:MBL fold metallo-hydrolase [Sedimenticola thiotaurini]